MPKKEYTPSELLAEIDGLLVHVSVSGESVIFLADARKKIGSLYKALKASEEVEHG